MTATVDNALAELQRANAELQQQLDERTAERDEALAREAATAEVLQVINASPGDLAPVFDAMLEKALRLGEAAFGVLFIRDGELFSAAATRNLSPQLEHFMREPFKPSPGGYLMRADHGEMFDQILDIKADHVRAAQDPRVQAVSDLGGARTLLSVALRKERTVVGAIALYRREVRPFSQKQIALVSTFADQAVIAIENARLITETREALDQQTATAEVLGVINSSPSDLAPVFDALLERATRLCGAAFGHLMTYADGCFTTVADLGGALVKGLSVRPKEGYALHRLMQGEAFVHVTKVFEDPAYEASPPYREWVEQGGVRTFLLIALRKDETLLGMLGVYSREEKPFTERRMALVQNFAAQAVIAMENARLLGELRTRTGDLQESLEYQTATSNVLKVISGSTFDIQPVFETIVETAARLCNAEAALITNREGEAYRVRATFSFSPEYDAFMRGRLIAADRGSVTGRTALTGQVVHIADLAHDPEFTLIETVTIGKFRTMLGVPLLREGIVVGTINLGRQRVEAYTNRQIELVRIFADQAVIAIENAGLITETREALDQQTATAEVLRVINSSPGDLGPVFDAMLEKATRLCGTASGHLAIWDGECFEAVAVHGGMGGIPRGISVRPIPGSGSILDRVVQGESLIHITDVFADSGYASPYFREQVDVGGIRAMLYVALQREGALLGVIGIYRREVRPFADKQIALLQNFAAQAVIAIENARLITETREALEQQTATAEVLGVINSSPGNLAPVFDAMLERALGLCEAALGGLATYDGEQFNFAAQRGFPPALAQQPLRPGPDTGLGRIASGERVVHIADIADSDAYRAGDPVRVASVDALGARSCVWVALVKDDAVLGVITAFRQEVRPFTDKQIALLQNFAAQAVIAMENARLLTETREALDQQTATAEVLGVINASPGDLKPVFDAMLDKALRLCEAAFGRLDTYDGAFLHTVATRGVPPAYADFLGRAVRPAPGNTAFRLVQGEEVVRINDMREDEENKKGDPARLAVIELGGARSMLQVGLRKDDVLIGRFVIYRTEVKPFSDKQVALLQNFAAQAVIAMENARLLGELRNRTSDLQESLEYQTASSDVLNVISRSAFDLEPILQSVVITAARLCRAEKAILYRLQDGAYRFAAGHSNEPEYERIERTTPIYPGEGTVAGRAALHKRVVQIVDPLADPQYESKEEARIGNARSMIGVPMLRDGVPVGVIALARERVEPFNDRQIELVQTFADQAIIAIENARLIAETREALDQQTATAEVLGVINSSPGDLKPVFQAIVEKALRLCQAGFGGMMTYDGELFHRVAVQDDATYTELYDRPIRPEPGTTIERIVRGENVVHIPDLIDDEAYRSGSRLRRELVELGGARSMISIALRKDDILLGALHVYRREPRPFSDKEVALLQNFAAQAVIAMENGRLLNETREARDDAETALRDLKAAQANLVQAEKMASLGQLTAGIAHEIKNPLNFVNNFASLSVELLDELKEATEPVVAALSDDKRAEIDETMVMLTGNLEKIAEHGKRADNIVKSMLEHSRGVSGERREIDLNQLVEEALNLAYHGARAQDQTFNITLERDYAEGLKPIELAPQEITRVFLNLFGNGFYAANKRSHENGGRSFRPTLRVATRDDRDAVEVRVRDNGTGIPAEIKEKLFQPFFTTKPTGEGTGLGLSISYDIVTQQHGGTIEVDSEVGEYTEFTVRLPRH
jgi:two-component system, NtrC family, sensor kinase